MVAQRIWQNPSQQLNSVQIAVQIWSYQKSTREIHYQWFQKYMKVSAIFSAFDVAPTSHFATLNSDLQLNFQSSTRMGNSSQSMSHLLPLCCSTTQTSMTLNVLRFYQPLHQVIVRYVISRTTTSTWKNSVQLWLIRFETMRPKSQ